MINKAAGSENIESQVLVGVWAALAIPLPADYSRVAISVENESVVGRRKDISQDLATNLRRDPQKGRVSV